MKNSNGYHRLEYYIDEKVCFIISNGKGTIHSVDEIYEAVWGMRPIGVENAVVVHIRHIREKIEENLAKPHYLKVAWGKL